MPETTIQEDVKMVCEELFQWEVEVREQSVFRCGKSTVPAERMFAIQPSADFAYSVLLEMDNQVYAREQFNRLIQKAARNPKKSIFGIVAPPWIVRAAASALRAGKEKK